MTEQYEWCTSERQRLIAQIEALKPKAEAITGNDHVLQHRDENLKTLDKLKRLAYWLSCHVPDLKEDIQTMALEAKEALEWNELSTNERECVAGLIDEVQTELDAGAKWDAPTVFERVNTTCVTAPAPPVIRGPPGPPPKEEYEVIGVETTEELFDVLAMGKLPQKREELR